MDRSQLAPFVRFGVSYALAHSSLYHVLFLSVFVPSMFSRFRMRLELGFGFDRVSFVSTASPLFVFVRVAFVFPTK